MSRHSIRTISFFLVLMALAFVSPASFSLPNGLVIFFLTAIFFLWSYLIDRPHARDSLIESRNFPRNFSLFRFRRRNKLGSRKLDPTEVLSMNKLPEEKFLNFVDGLLQEQGCNTSLILHRSDTPLELIAKRNGKTYGTLLVQSPATVPMKVVEMAVESSSLLSLCGTIVITNNFFTPEAFDFAAAHSCKLVDATLLSKWTQLQIPVGL